MLCLYRLNQNISVRTNRYLVQAFCCMGILCLNIRLLSESDLWVQNSVNKESYVDWSMFATNFLALQQKGGFQT